MTVRFLAEAGDELREAIRWYGEINPALGEDFRSEFKAIIDMIRSAPEAWRPMFRGARRLLMRRFLYGIVYRAMPADDSIVIVAVMHLSRRPGYWRERS